MSLPITQNTPVPVPAAFITLPRAKTTINPPFARSHSDSDLDFRDISASRSSVRPLFLPALPGGPKNVGPAGGKLPIHHNSAPITDLQITDLEMEMRSSMGPWALDGLRKITQVTVAAATVISFAFAVVPLAVPVLPGLGAIIFVSALTVGVLIGIGAQALARHYWLRNGGNPQELLAKSTLLKETLEAKPNLTGSEIMQLRRLQILEGDIRGGFKHAFWSVLFGIANFDPKLKMMMRHASDRA